MHLCLTHQNLFTMKHRISYLFFALTLLAFGQENPNQSQSEFLASLDEKIPLQLKEKNVPGMAIAIVENGEVIYQKGIGFSNTEKQTKITPET